MVIPSLGLQLETHKGVADISLVATRTFVPWSALEDVLINEGIRGWDIRCYLIAVTRATQGPLQLRVAFKVHVCRFNHLYAAGRLIMCFQNILPRFPVLLEVYHGVQDALGTENSRSNS